MLVSGTFPVRCVYIYVSQTLPGLAQTHYKTLFKSLQSNFKGIYHAKCNMSNAMADGKYLLR